MIRVVFPDDLPTFRRRRCRLPIHAGQTVIGEPGDLSEAEAQVQALQPEPAVLGLRLPGVAGLAGTPRLNALVPTLRVILSSAYGDQADLLQTAAVQAGAEAFVAKDDPELRVVQS